MDKAWSEKNKRMQTLLAKEATFRQGIAVLIELRNDLFEEISSIIKMFPAEAYYQLPFGTGKGNHRTTLAWSLWHIFRIEDIVCHTLISNDRQIFLKDKWQEKINSPIITTANELNGERMTGFSRQLDVKALYEYCKTVKTSTEEVLQKMEYAELKRKLTDSDKARLIQSNCVSPAESSVWLIDYWCGKNVKGLIQMPFGRHWIMHVEAMRKIKNRLSRHSNFYNSLL